MKPNNRSNKYIKVSSLVFALAVAIGAFGAHMLNDVLARNNRLNTFDIASKYHFYHAIGLFIVSILSTQYESKYLEYSFNLMILGIFFFSGSLYLLSITNIGLLGAITPIGGVLFIAAWFCIFLMIFYEQRNR